MEFFTYICIVIDILGGTIIITYYDLQFGRNELDPNFRLKVQFRNKSNTKKPSKFTFSIEKFSYKKESAFQTDRNFPGPSIYC